MERPSPALRSRAGVGVALVVLLAGSACAQVLGLEDPKGQLGEGGAGSGTAQGSPGGTGAGSPTSTGEGTGTGGATSSTGSTGTGTGGGGDPEGFVTLPADFTIAALGPADTGASLLVTRTGLLPGASCASEASLGAVAALHLQGGECSFVGEIASPQGISLEGLDVAMRSPWVAVAGRGPIGTNLQLPGAPDVALPAGETPGFTGWWEVGGAGDALLRTMTFTQTARVLPSGVNGGFLAYTSIDFRLEPLFPGDPCSPVSSGAQRVWAPVLDAGLEGCGKPADPVAGELLDAASGNRAWGLVEAGGTCTLVDFTENSAAFPLPFCGPTGNLLVHVEGEDDQQFVATGGAGPCDGGLAILRLVNGADDSLLWCNEEPLATTRAYPVAVIDQRLWFVRQDEGQPAILHVSDAESEDVGTSVRELCEGCEILGAVATGGRLHVAGIATTGAATVMGTSVDEGLSFWAWVPLAEL